ncbi:MAG TPA: hypothetical protein VF974_02045 [Patescibacteria group bacterium]
MADEHPNGESTDRLPDLDYGDEAQFDHEIDEAEELYLGSIDDREPVEDNPPLADEDDV